MFLKVSLLALSAIFDLARAQTGIATDSPKPTLASSLNDAPTFVATIDDVTAPDSQKICPGYKASNVQQSSDGTIVTDLILAGEACNTYGTDIEELSLLVEYQSKERLHVQILPKYLVPQNSSWYFLPEYISGYPGAESHTVNDLDFKWSNEPSFQFEISRASTNETLFTTYGHVIVYQNQFLELATSMADDYNVYGLAENTHDFRLGTNYTQTYYAADAGNTVDFNAYGIHPMYIETRWENGTNKSSQSTSHGVYARNAHAQEWLLRSDNITYRTIGGSFDFYFLSGPSPKDVIAQYQAGIVGKPIMQQYWTFGLGQCRWGYQNWTVLQEVIDNYRKFDLPLETIWTDIDYMSQYRDFTNDPNTFPVPEGQEFLEKLYADNQHYVPILDANIYVPDPTNASDAYEPFERGNSMNAFIRDGADSLYYGVNWPGFSVWADWLVPQAQDFWTSELTEFFARIPFSGIWLDLNEASSFVVGSKGEGHLDENPAHPPFPLPGDPGDVDYRYPEGFNITNATEAASLTAASIAQASSVALTAISTSTSPAIAYATPTPGAPRQLNYPPYVINNVFAGHALTKNSIAPNATHNDEFESVEYDYHNVFGHMSLNATRQALLAINPKVRPFVIGRSTFAGSGTVAAHWGGDNNSKWGSMYFSISQALTFMIAGIPMFGADACGFSGNTDMELCTRWMEMAAFFPFYRNHNVLSSISQEPYTWASTAAATRTVLGIRYSLLPYLYTLFYNAHTKADTVMNHLSWEFPNDGAYLRGVDNQFMLGSSLLVTPVLEPLARTVKGVFPGVKDGTIWYDWYNLSAISVSAYENKTLEAPLEHINLHIRGGSILPLQTPGYTTAESRNGTWEVLVTLDKDGQAAGELYLDDGVSEAPEMTKTVELSFKDDRLSAEIEGGYEDGNTLGKITVAGLKGKPRTMAFRGQECFGSGVVDVVFKGGVLVISGLEALAGKAWDGDWEVEFGY